jgi:DNA end-binding protein Ku
MTGLPLPGDAEAMGLTDRELKMGEQLVLDMAEPWSPERFRDEFAEKVEALVEAKRKTGAITQVVELMPGEVTPSADIIDLTELLRRSLKPKTAAAPAPAARVKRAANDEAPSRRREPVLEAAAAKGSAKSRAAVKPTSRKR